MHSVVLLKNKALLHFFLPGHEGISLDCAKCTTFQKERKDERKIRKKKDNNIVIEYILLVLRIASFYTYAVNFCVIPMGYGF